MKYNMNENKTKASQIDKHLKYNNQVSYNIYNVDQMAEKINGVVFIIVKSKTGA